MSALDPVVNAACLHESRYSTDATSPSKQGDDMQ
jgi:hypothetical protein